MPGCGVAELIVTLGFVLLPPPPKYDAHSRKYHLYHPVGTGLLSSIEDLPGKKKGARYCADSTNPRPYLHLAILGYLGLGNRESAGAFRSNGSRVKRCVNWA